MHQGKKDEPKEKFELHQHHPRLVQGLPLYSSPFGAQYSRYPSMVVRLSEWSGRNATKEKNGDKGHG